ncbi:MAG: hypothetical protein WD556_05265 [Actinomycetota bacterium]
MHFLAEGHDRGSLDEEPEALVAPEGGRIPPGPRARSEVFVDRSAAADRIGWLLHRVYGHYAQPAAPWGG